MIHFISWESRIMKIESVKIEKIIPYELNNKIHDETQINRIANSIREFWFLQPLVIDKNNIIIVWHGRYEASQKLWLKEIPCVRAENLTDEQIKKFRILDNKLNESAWNMENLKVELQELWNLDIWELELSVEELFPDLQFDEEEEKEIEEDESPEVEAKAKIVGGGDLFILWQHRLLCGDATKIENIHELIDWNEIDMIFTDPPYNIWYSGVSDKRTIKNDKMEDEKFVEFLKNSLQYCETSYVCCSRQYSHLFKQAMTELWMPPKAMIVRNKVNPAQHLDKYFKQHELIFYYWKFGGEKTLRWDIRECKRQKNTVHPTMKPLELIWMALKDNPDKKNILDMFGWSGSTLIACEQLNRKCFMLELDPRYCEVIIKRFHNINPDAEIKCLNRDIDLTVLFDEE